MFIVKLAAIIFLLVSAAAVGKVSCSPRLGGTSCTGGRSVRGVSHVHELLTGVDAESHRLRTASCCDDVNSCHGGFLLDADHLFTKLSSSGSALGTRRIVSIDPHSDLSQLYNALQRVEEPLPNKNESRRKRSIERQQSDEQQCVTKEQSGHCFPSLPDEIRCCSTNVSVFFPISATSALTGERVHVIQAPPLMIQAVMYARCESVSSYILDAVCQQDLKAESMFVMRIDVPSGELQIIREPVLVESGCSCRMNPEPLEIFNGPNIDNDAIATLLSML